MIVYESNSKGLQTRNKSITKPYEPKLTVLLYGNDVTFSRDFNFLPGHKCQIHILYSTLNRVPTVKYIFYIQP